jgi:hypothetical protein
MYPLNRLARLAVVIIPALVLTGCAPVKVMSYTERGVDFSRYHTFAWGAPDDKPTGDPRLDNNPFFHERVQAEVERQLSERGLVKADRAMADFTVNYRASITDEIELNGANLPPDNYDESQTAPYVYQAGAVVFELKETGTNRVLWRAWAEGSLEGVVNNQKWMEEKIGEIVKKVFEQFPSRTHE